MLHSPPPQRVPLVRRISTPSRFPKVDWEAGLEMRLGMGLGVERKVGLEMGLEVGLEVDWRWD